MSFKISKSFQVTYSHRLHNQDVTEWACDAKNKCRQIHGHNGVVKIKLKSNEVNEQGMVLDFADLNQFKKELDEVIDHKTILYVRGPIIPLLFSVTRETPIEGDEELPDISFNEERMEWDHHSIPLHPDFDGSMKYWHYRGTGNHMMMWGENKEIKCPTELLEEYFGSFVFVDFIPTAENLAKWIFDYLTQHYK